MNTINFITAIALLACILTPAYVLYFLKHQLLANQKKHKAIIDTISKDLSKLHYEVEKIQFDEIENRLERHKQILELNEKLDSSDMKHSINQNTIDNINVTLDYFRRTLNDDMSKVNERIDLTNALHTAFVAKSEDLLNDSVETFNKKFQSSIQLSVKGINKLQADVDSLQSLNITTQQILNRINSKEFVGEILVQWMRKLQQEKIEKEQKEANTKVKGKRGRPAKQQEHNVRNITATELFNEEQGKQEEPIVEVEQKEKRKRTPKKNSKRLITMREIETAFKQKTGLTYRGYVLKFGEKEFLRKKANVYDSVYYQKFTKPKQQSLATTI
jgi:hypothetical protein